MYNAEYGWFCDKCCLEFICSDVFDVIKVKTVVFSFFTFYFALPMLKSIAISECSPVATGKMLTYQKISEITSKISFSFINEKYDLSEDEKKFRCIKVSR